MAHSLCPVSTPTQVQMCNSQDCPPEWSPGLWSQVIGRKTCIFVCWHDENIAKNSAQKEEQCKLCDDRYFASGSIHEYVNYVYILTSLPKCSDRRACQKWTCGVLFFFWFHNFRLYEFFKAIKAPSEITSHSNIDFSLG